MAAADLTAQRLRELLHYAPDTGVFTRLVRTSNSIQVGDIAGSLTPRGYSEISVDGRQHLAHRLAWLYAHGHWPTHGIDHRDGNPSNNRLANLREATQAENLQNLRKRAGCTSGHPGVSWLAPNRKWRAQIQTSGRTVHLGLFLTEAEAHAAYLAAKRAHHPFGTL